MTRVLCGEGQRMCIMFLIPPFRCGIAFHRTRPILFIHLLSVKELLSSVSRLLRYNLRTNCYNKNVIFCFFSGFILERVSLGLLAPPSYLLNQLSLSHVFITQQAADLKTNLEQLTRAILSSFVYVTLVSRRSCVMVATGNLIGKAWHIFIFSYLGKSSVFL
jgi:hypothetical protein